MSIQTTSITKKKKNVSDNVAIYAYHCEMVKLKRILNKLVKREYRQFDLYEIVDYFCIFSPFDRLHFVNIRNHNSYTLSQRLMEQS